MEKKNISLAGQWRMAWCPIGAGTPEGFPMMKTLPYDVPGDVHTPLVDAGLIAEPLEGMNDLEDTLYNTAATINKDITGLDMSSDVMVNRTSDFSSFADAFTKANGGTWVFPIYLGGDLLDTVVVDALDRYNFQTGGH